MLVAGLVLAGGAAIFQLSFGPWTLPDSAMYPAYPRGRTVWARKGAYTGVEEVRRGDVVVIGAPFAAAGSATTGGGDVIARVVALPGERVAIRVDRVMLDGQEFALRVLRHEAELTVFEETPAAGLRAGRPRGVPRYEVALPKQITDPRAGDLAETLVPPDHLFVLADNRRQTARDSRTLGPLPFAQVLGRLN